MQDLIDSIYRAMGLDDCSLPLSVVDGFLSDWLAVFPDSECLALHNTVVSSYEWLVRNAATTSSGGGKRREKNGRREIELDGFDMSGVWNNALDSYLESPWSAFPTCRDELGVLNTGRVIVGGVDENAIQDINNNPNIRTGGADEVCGVRRGSGWGGLRNTPNGWTLRGRSRRRGC